MSFWTAMVVIVGIIALASIRIERIRVRERRDGSNAGELPGPPPAELEREILDLKKRLAVLERIATDDRQSQAIAHEIEQLRDR